MLPFFFEIEMSFGKNGRCKRENVKIHYRSAHFGAQTYAFTLQKLWFYTSKPMVLHLKNYVFAIQKHRFYQKIPDFSCQEKTRYHYNLLLTKKLWKALQNSRISRPIDRSVYNIADMRA